MKVQLQNRQPQKKTITLMTILANESTKQSQELLQKYGMPKAKNYRDLEESLGKLYVAQTDKVKLEKEMAEIHPHAKWILKTIQVEQPQPTPTEQLAEQKKPEVYSFFDDQNMHCNCPNCQHARYSNFGGNQNKDSQNPPKEDWKQFIGPFAMLTLLCLTAVVVIRSTSKQN